MFRRKPGSRQSSRQNDTSPAAIRESSGLVRARLPVDLLAPGMRVVKLDRPWTEVPVLFQGFEIRESRQIDTLRHYCRWVLVEGEAPQMAEAQSRLNQLQTKLHKPLTEKKPLSEVLPQARRTFGRTQEFIDRTLSAIQGGKTPELDEARPLIQACVKSIGANANAMFWLTRIKSQDAYTAEHCLRVAIYAIAFARFIGMPEEDLEVVGLCGLLHDIGKVKVRSEVLNKPGALTDAETAEIRQHAELGYQLLQSHHSLEPIVSDVTLHHHERMDGRGYPNQLEEWQISRFARLIAIVDAYDAITSDRCYRKGLPASDALRILYRGRAEQFDAEMVEAFIRMLGIYPPGTLVELNTGEVGLIIATHPGKKLHPRVEILLNANKRPQIPYIIDLSTAPQDGEGQTYAILKPLPDGAHGVSLGDRIQQIVTADHFGAGEPE